MEVGEALMKQLIKQLIKKLFITIAIMKNDFFNKNSLFKFVGDLSNHLTSYWK